MSNPTFVPREKRTVTPNFGNAEAVINRLSDDEMVALIRTAMGEPLNPPETQLRRGKPGPKPRFTDGAISPGKSVVYTEYDGRKKRR